MKKQIITIVTLLVVAGLGYFLYGVNSQGNTEEVSNTSANSANTQQSDNNVLGENTEVIITSENVSYHEGTQGYLARPAEEGVYPAVVLIHEWWGLNENIQDLADDFAEQGYVALAVDLYDGEFAETPDEAGQLAGAVRSDTDGAFANLSDAMAYIKNLEYVDEEKVASVGWCFGGQWAYNMAKNNLGVAASVMYYGRFSMEDDLSMMRADILGHFGEEDRSIEVDTVKEFRAKLETLDGDHAVYIYPNAGHAFANEDNEEAYNEEAAMLAWQRTMDFLTEELDL